MGKPPYEAMEVKDLKDLVGSVKPDDMATAMRDFRASRDDLVKAFMSFQQAMASLNGEGWSGSAANAALEENLKAGDFGGKTAISSASVGGGLAVMATTLGTSREGILAMPYDDPAGKLLVGSASTYPGMGSLRDAYKEAQDKADRQRQEIVKKVQEMARSAEASRDQVGGITWPTIPKDIKVEPPVEKLPEALEGGTGPGGHGGWGSSSTTGGGGAGGGVPSSGGHVSGGGSVPGGRVATPGNTGGAGSGSGTGGGHPAGSHPGGPGTGPDGHVSGSGSGGGVDDGSRFSPAGVDPNTPGTGTRPAAPSFPGGTTIPGTPGNPGSSIPTNPSGAIPGPGGASGGWWSPGTAGSPDSSGRVPRNGSTGSWNTRGLTPSPGNTPSAGRGSTTSGYSAGGYSNGGYSAGGGNTGSGGVGGGATPRGGPGLGEPARGTTNLRNGAGFGDPHTRTGTGGTGMGPMGGGTGRSDQEQHLRRQDRYRMTSDELWGVPTHAVPPIIGDEGAMYLLDDDDDDY
ncbi:hypothetical protein KEM60_00440 [Austwickia sp. TVS 96-490-7B]|uniref:hypothetical protein n=1 Tax=Austwickia sp. TVS 96-490-7B TaxID=2830843 RepID=UPI001C586C4D|nr:hypothetical protein [Austwickia sp. TVS 96-490-7B]MBW3084253.1 hypothetical protein [Austwickia sp. TVS 96-490-7B]